MAEGDLGGGWGGRGAGSGNQISMLRPQSLLGKQ